MKQNVRRLVASEWMFMLLWGVTILSPVFAGAYAFKHRSCLPSQARPDLGCLTRTEPNASELEVYLAEDQEIIETMMGDTLLVKSPPKANPVTEVDIIGREALVNGRLLGVGDQIQDATITAVSARYVTVQWNGTSTTFSPINGQEREEASSRTSPRPRGGSTRPSTTRKRPKRSEPRSVRIKAPRGSKPVPTPKEKERLKKMPPPDEKAVRKLEKVRLKNMPSLRPKLPKKGRLKKG